MLCPSLRFRQMTFSLGRLTSIFTDLPLASNSRLKEKMVSFLACYPCLHIQSVKEPGRGCCPSLRPPRFLTPPRKFGKLIEAKTSHIALPGPHYLHSSRDRVQTTSVDTMSQGTRTITRLFSPPLTAGVTVRLVLRTTTSTSQSPICPFVGFQEIVNFSC